MSSTKAHPPKAYLRIGEVASLVGVEPHVLRYWEREFRWIRPEKSQRGQRVYSRRDVERLLQVRDLLYNEGFTIAGAKKQLRGGTGSPLADVVNRPAAAAPTAPTGHMTATESVARAERAPLREAVSAAHQNAQSAPSFTTAQSRADADTAAPHMVTLLAVRSEIEALLAELSDEARPLS